MRVKGLKRECGIQLKMEKPKTIREKAERSNLIDRNMRLEIFIERLHTGEEKMSRNRLKQVKGGESKYIMNSENTMYGTKVDKKKKESEEHEISA